MLPLPSNESCGRKRYDDEPAQTDQPLRGLLAIETG
jgi:hypothetical protein